jgi:translation initiation factor 1
VRVRRERSGRRGKTVTVAAPFELARAEAAELLTRLKKRCGSGGTLKSAAGESVFSIEIQGDHVETVLAALSAAGYAARRAGG